MSEQYQYVIGMDCGTTNIKAVVLRDDGYVAAKASRPSTFYQPGPSMNEQDANEWWQNAADIFKELTSQMQPSEVSDIKGVCISSHTVTLLPVDENGIPLRMAITYQDGRSSGELDEILEKTGFDNFVRIVGGQPSVAFLPNKILWFKRYEPEAYAKTSYFLQASSFINYRLTGVMISDIDQALRTQCMNITTLDWAEEIASAIEVDLNEKMPPVKNVDEIIGYVTEEASKETGLPEGTPVMAGCSDAMAAMYATGISRLGEAGESSGTTSLVFVGSDVKSEPDVPVVTRPCAIDGIPWIFDAPIQSSGAAIRWFIDKFAGEEKIFAKEHNHDIYDYLNEMASQAKPGSGGLIFFPYLLGERAPLWNDHASGMFIGMRMNMDRKELVRSIFEGTAYALRHVIETVEESGAKVHFLHICGGGSKSRTWNQIKASVLNVPVYVMSGESGDVPVGDALIAGHKVGLFPDLSKAVQKIMKVEEIIYPDPDWVKVYNQIFPYYKSMYRKLDSELKNMQQTLADLQN